MSVTIRGELLLLTAWERGTWNEKENTWALPPLMPRQMLERFSAQGRSAALRQEDTRRDYYGERPRYTGQRAAGDDNTEVQVVLADSALLGHQAYIEDKFCGHIKGEQEKRGDYIYRLRTVGLRKDHAHQKAAQEDRGAF